VRGEEKLRNKTEDFSDMVAEVRSCASIFYFVTFFRGGMSC
jgi:hypothetical protein